MASPTLTIDTASPPGSWRSALAPKAWCKGCGQAVCDHPDAVYQGLLPRPVGA